jgi:putative nucleotidyltransferase with HDIG domain
MAKKEFQKAVKLSLLRLYKDKEKELNCHVRFVLKVGLELAEQYRADKDIITLSCLLHDIGRDHETGDEDHGDAGARIAAGILKQTNIPQEEVATILSCIKFHTKDLSNYTLEQKIVITADCATKVLYHEAFMLLCKKQTYEEKLAWGKKYLEKGYSKTLFPDYKRYITPKYNSLKQTYDAVTIPLKV